MSAINNIFHKAKEVANAAGKKTGSAVELSKLKLQIMQLRSQIQSTYERIGILVYEQEKTGSDNGEGILTCIKEIDQLLAGINDINESIALLKDGVKCPACGTGNSVDQRYCKKCGVSIKAAAEAQNTEKSK